MRTNIVLLLTLLAVSTTRAVVESDSLVLMEILRQNPNNTLTWDTTGGTQLTNWKNISVGPDGRISLLWIDNANISVLPSSFGTLVGLQNFSATNNNLTSLPANFSSLSKLANCNLGNNELTSLPSDFGNLTAMRYLYLTNNVLWKGTFPSNFFNMTSLTILHIGGNGKNFLSSSISSFQRLSELITDCSDQDPIPSQIASLPNLYKVGIYGYDLTQIPTAVFNCDSLESLEIGGPDFTTFPSSFTGLKKLQRLTLSQTSVTTLPASIGNCSNLKYLWLKGNKLSSISSIITGLKALQILDITDNEFTTIPEYFFQNPNMYEIRADSNNIASIASISSSTASSSKVNRIYLADNNLTALPSGFQNLPISTLDLSNNQFATISNIPTNISTLTLNNNNLTTFPSSLVGHTKLSYLYMRDNKITSVPSGLPTTDRLRRLDMTNNSVTSLPSDIGNVPFMLAMKFGGNRITSIPTSIGNFVYVDTLQFDNNYFSKTFAFPASITNLKNREMTLWMNSLMKASQTAAVVTHLDSIAPGWQAPLYTSAPAGDTLEVGETFTFTVSANDEDGDNSKLRYSFVDSIAGMIINTITGAINYTAAVGDVGNHTITIRALDEYREFNDTSFTIRVTGGAGSVSYYLKAGWGMISFPFEADDMSPQAVFNDLGSLQIMKDDNGKSFIPSVYSTIDTLDITDGYLIYMDQVDTLVLNGTQVDVSTPISLKVGWNILPYLPAAGQNAVTVFSSIASKVEVVKDDAGGFYLPAQSLNTIGNMKPGKGYRIYMNEAATFNY